MFKGAGLFQGISLQRHTCWHLDFLSSGFSVTRVDGGESATVSGSQPGAGAAFVGSPSQDPLAW